MRRAKPLPRPSVLPAEADAALATWRRCDPGMIDKGSISAMRRALADAPLLRHRCWPAALRGHTVAAIAVALDILAEQGPRTLAADIAMSRLLLDAARGDPAATLVLAHALFRLSRCTGLRSALDRSERWARRLPAAVAPRRHR